MAKITQYAYFGFETYDPIYNSKYVSNFGNNFTPSIQESISLEDTIGDLGDLGGVGYFSNEVFVGIVAQIQSQYKNTNNEYLLRDLVEIFRIFVFEAWKSLFFHNFYLSTANGDSLDLWGNILGLNRQFPSENVNKDYNYFNFDDKRFYNLIFYNPTQPEYASLDDESFRKLLLLLLQKQFIDNNLDSANEFLNRFFEEYGGITIQDSTNMESGFVWFLENVPAFLKYYLVNKDVLPRPACVGMGTGNNKNRYFGFATGDVLYDIQNVGAFNSTNFINAALI